MDARKRLSRRALLEGFASSGCAALAGAFLLGMIPVRESAVRWQPRPPGALPGEAFSAACARCGQCVSACPYETLRLSSLRDPVPIGTPYFTPREIPCYMCRDLPCVKACPTGALNPELTDIREARMGVAVVDPNSCLSWQGLRCEVCFRECPENGRALTIEVRPRGLSRHAVFVPVIHPDACTGCGLCEKACPTEEAAIRVADPTSVLGTIGSHYRLGWLSEEDPKNLRRDGPPAAPSAEPPAEEDGSPPAAAPGLDYLNNEEPL